MKKILRMLYISGIVITPGFCIAQMSVQADSNKSTVRVAANVQYNKAGKLKRIMLGNHYRKEWATEVDVHVLDMDTQAGGLTPIKLGGGFQTSSLRLQGADGKQYVLRSVNKNPSKAIAEELRGTFAEDIVQDQISSANPFAPVVVASLASAAGIFHNNPQIVYVPASARLAKYNETFAGTLCVFEERPSGDESVNEHYGNAKKIINSEKLFGKIFSNSNHQVDEKAFLKARLFDMLISDWDRHEDQWQWAAFETGGKTFYKPIPRDRDQAFPKMDGAIPQMAARKWALRKIQDFDYTIRDVNGLNTNGGYLDRMFTTRLSLSDWLSVSAELQKSLTDEVIDAACVLFPKEIYSLSGKETAAKLKRRRDDLQQYAREYYHFVSKEINITGTNAKEIFEVIRLNNDSTRVTVYGGGKQSNEFEIIYQRSFLHSETKEIRLCGLDGDDIFNVSGNADKGVLVRIIGGGGMDIMNDESEVKGAAKKTKMYDDEVNIFNTGSEGRKFISTDTLKNNFYRRSFRYDWLAPFPVIGYNPDDGTYIGGGFTFKKQGFGKKPFSSMHTTGGSYAFSTGAYNFFYKGLLKERIGKWDIAFGAAVNAPNYSRNYFGLGNESERLDTVNNYYRVRFNQVITNISLKRRFGTKHFIETGLGFESVKVEQNDGRFVSSSTSKLDSADFGRNNYASIKLNYQFNTLNNEFYPTKGMKIISGATFTQDVEERSKNFVQLYYQASFYTTKGRFTLASSSGASTNLNNDYAFFQANTLSGTANLRGYRRDRFAGKTMLYSNTELRYNAGMANGYFLRGCWGLLAFVDNGRVWVPDEKSNEWHTGYGGGLWFVPFNKMSFTATYGMSDEGSMLSIKGGFLF